MIEYRPVWNVLARPALSVSSGDVLEVGIESQNDFEIGCPDKFGEYVFYAKCKEGVITLSEQRKGSWHRLFRAEQPIATTDLTLEMSFSDSEITFALGCLNVTVRPSKPTCEIVRFVGKGYFGAARYRSTPIQNSLTVTELTKNVDRLGEVQNDLIYDFGMHDGSDTGFYLAKGFRVIAIEANPDMATAVAEKFRDFILDGRLAILSLGVFEASGQSEFYINPHVSQFSSFYQDLGARKGSSFPVKVNVVRPMEIFACYGVPYYVKIDIEGSDKFVAEDICKLPLKPRFVSYENGGLYIFNLLTEAGYTFFKFVVQGQHNNQPLPQPAREGLYVEYRFSKGSSGPFGEETVGPWQSEEEIRPLIERYEAMRRKGESPWGDAHVDLHAKW